MRADPRSSESTQPLEQRYTYPDQPRSKDWAVLRAWSLGRAATWFPAESERVRLPLLPQVLVRFIQDMLAAPRALATVRRYLSTLSTLHRLLDVPDLTKTAVVRNTLKARARRSGAQVQAAPLRWAEVAAILDVLPDDLAGLRDKTLLAVAHNTLARRAELVALDVADVSFLDGGVGTVTLRPTKINLEAEPNYRFLGAPATALVREWQASSTLREGLFPACNATGRSVSATANTALNGRCWLGASAYRPRR